MAPTDQQPPTTPPDGPRSPRDPGNRTGGNQGTRVLERDRHYDDSGSKLRDLEHVGAMAPDTDPLDSATLPPAPSPSRR